MKGRRREMIREELHLILKGAFNVIFDTFGIWDDRAAQPGILEG